MNIKGKISSGIHIKGNVITGGALIKGKISGFKENNKNKIVCIGVIIDCIDGASGTVGVLNEVGTE